MTIEMAFNIAMSLVAGLLGLTIKHLYARIDTDRKAFDEFKSQTNQSITDIKVTYLPKSELNRTQDQIMASLNSLSNKMDKINDKLDQKADK
ncbi:hypothetical protein [Wohlfahrtiimonas larvae]|uniref:Uncharacterized protein n=1 Tax=Wohlfahrtiimonas larvae TaxID=1157986 RepID=A0ABP9MW80_9GAMM|nr:hypothetical protein [Wohlfahrtiimonas larvae]